MAVDNKDEALRVAKSLKCADLILDSRYTTPDDAELLVDEVTAPRNRGHGGCSATIVLPDSQIAFSYACKITRKHGTVMTVSIVPILKKHFSFDIAVARMECEICRPHFQRFTHLWYISTDAVSKFRNSVCQCEGR